MLKVKLLDPRAIAPSCANPGEDLGYDLHAIEDTTLKPGVLTKVKTGIAAYWDSSLSWTIAGEKYGLLMRDRSSMASKGVFLSGGVIDAGYRGELCVLMTRTLAPGMAAASDGSYLIKAGDKVAQMIPMPVLTQYGVEVVAELAASSRGDNGFGSSGR